MGANIKSIHFDLTERTVLVELYCSRQNLDCSRPKINEQIEIGNHIPIVVKRKLRNKFNYTSE